MALYEVDIRGNGMARVFEKLEQEDITASRLPNGNLLARVEAASRESALKKVRSIADNEDVRVIARRLGD